MTEKQAIEILKEIKEGSRAWLRVAKEKNSEKMYLRNIEAIETILNMLKEKDKIIDLLLDKLNQNYNTVFKNNEVKEIIEIYEKIKNISDLYGIKLRKECIKQYFERKVEN